MKDKTLENLRNQIDTLDEDLLHLLAQRIELVRKIGALKKTYGIAALDEKRFKDLLASKLARAKILNLSEAFVKRLFHFIHEHSLELQKKSK